MKKQGIAGNAAPSILILSTVGVVLLGLMHGLASSATIPYPPSPVIKGITFAPSSSITRQASGSDNWPVTWGDDDKLYTAFGDGWGFDPKLPSKACLGTARVSGGATSYSGQNLATISDGSSCIKATGILMVDGTLYVWTRRNGGKLWKSSNRGSSWQNTGVAMEQSNGAFGSLTFLQFGKNYQNARDGYVYVYARNQDEFADEVVLFRVPKNKIADRVSYEYYVGLDSGGNPLWSSDITQRAAIFRDPGRVADLRAVYNPGIDRYLMTTWFGTGGGIGIYDAPEPWGPWTTVFYTSKWDQGFTFEYDFPRKWMSADGLTMYMVFSGTGVNDAFCVREVRLTVTDPDTTSPASPTNLREASSTSAQ